MWQAFVPRIYLSPQSFNHQGQVVLCLHFSGLEMHQTTINSLDANQILLAIQPHLMIEGEIAPMKP